MERDTNWEIGFLFYVKVQPQTIQILTIKHRNTDFIPLSIKLSTDRLSLITLLFEYIAIPLSRGRYSIISKLHIIYKSQLCIGYYLQAGNYLQGLLRHCSSPYKQGYVAPSLHYKYQVPSYSFHSLIPTLLTHVLTLAIESFVLHVFLFGAYYERGLDFLIYDWSFFAFYYLENF